MFGCGSLCSRGTRFATPGGLTLFAGLASLGGLTLFAGGRLKPRWLLCEGPEPFVDGG